MKAEYYGCRRSVPGFGHLSRGYCQAKVHRRRTAESATARNKAPTRTSSTGRNTINRMIVGCAMEMESSLAIPSAIATPSHAEFTPNRPHLSYATAFRFTLCPGLGARLARCGEISVFPSRSDQKVARVARVARFRSVGLRATRATRATFQPLARADVNISLANLRASGVPRRAFAEEIQNPRPQSVSS